MKSKTYLLIIYSRNKMAFFKACFFSKLTLSWQSWFHFLIFLNEGNVNFKSALTSTSIYSPVWLRDQWFNSTLISLINVGVWLLFWENSPTFLNFLEFCHQILNIKLFYFKKSKNFYIHQNIIKETRVVLLE